LFPWMGADWVWLCLNRNGMGILLFYLLLFSLQKGFIGSPLFGFPIWSREKGAI